MIMQIAFADVFDIYSNDRLMPQADCFVDVFDVCLAMTSYISDDYKK